MERRNEIRCAVIGYGGACNMGFNHSNWINAAPGMKTVAVCDVVPDRLEQAKKDFPGIKTFSDYREVMKDSDIDLVVIITPHSTHFEIGMEAIRHGKHVVMEKPMCLHVSEADAMIEEAKKQGVTLTVFHNRRHDGDYMAMKEIIEKGIIGEVYRIEFCLEMWEHIFPKTWRSVKALSGGIFYDWGPHIVDWTLNLMGEKIESVYALTQKRVWMDTDIEDEIQVIVRFSDGKIGDMQLSFASMGHNPNWRIIGTKGAIVQDRPPVLELGYNSFKVYTEVEGYPAEMTIKHKKSDWEKYYVNLSAHLLEGAPLEVTPESARRVIAVIETAYKSADSGKVEIPPVD
jgi:predicted dehydrogenase